MTTAQHPQPPAADRRLWPLYAAGFTTAVGAHGVADGPWAALPTRMMPPLLADGDTAVTTGPRQEAQARRRPHAPCKTNRPLISPDVSPIADPDAIET